LAARAGIESKEFSDQIAQAITAARGGKGQAAAGLLGKAVQDLDPEQRKKLEEMQRGGPDPMDKLVDKIGEGNRFLEALVRSNKAAEASLRDLNSKTGHRDAEAGDTGTGRRTTE
jgi:hypothetical protein